MLLTKTSAQWTKNQKPEKKIPKNSRLAKSKHLIWVCLVRSFYSENRSFLANEKGGRKHYLPFYRLISQGRISALCPQPHSKFRDIFWGNGIEKPTGGTRYKIQKIAPYKVQHINTQIKKIIIYNMVIQVTKFLEITHSRLNRR